MEFVCIYCSKGCKNHNSHRNHERLCSKNPNRKELNSNNFKSMFGEFGCEFCGEICKTKQNLRKHAAACDKNPFVITTKGKTCPVCEKVFVSTSTTCSYSCSNTLFRHKQEGGTQYKTDDALAESGRYREICFRYHEAKCIICSEDKIVEVHHLNENHDDNRPQNLVPLCPTHHQYYHSKFRELIEPQILEYVKTRIA